jgi:hypothetical protein
MGGEPADLLADVRHVGREGVVVGGLQAHDAGALRGAEPDREHRPERERDLPEDVARVALPEDALDAVDELDRLDPAFQHGEERTVGALVGGELARLEVDVGGGSADALALALLQRREDRDRADLLRRHHGGANLTRRR